MTKLKNNKIEQSKNYEFLTIAAEKIIQESIKSMFEKLSKLQHVEYIDLNEDGIETCKLNSDTAFREDFYNAIEEEISINFRNY